VDFGSGVTALYAQGAVIENRIGHSMKQCLLICLTTFAVASSAHAQGTLFFANHVTGVFSAQVTHPGFGNVPPGPVGSDFYGQLLAAPLGGTLDIVGMPVEFRDDQGIGYITSGGVVSVPGVAPGSPAQVEMVAWHKALGSDWYAALAAGVGGIGISGLITVVTGGAGTPPSPPALLGLAGGTAENTLQPFQISVIPEPSTSVLTSLGAALLGFRLRRKPKPRCMRRTGAQGR
jgi:hypothetical protein